MPLGRSRPDQRRDGEKDARLSRLRSELDATRALPTADGTCNKQIEALERKLAEIGDENDRDKWLVAIHEAEAEICLLKPHSLLYPTWIRLQGNLYRFDKARADAWTEDMTQLIRRDAQKDPGDIARQRMRQLTLELQEAAENFKRLAEERAHVVRKVYSRALWWLLWTSLALLACVATAWLASPDWLLVLSLPSCVSAGGMGAVFSRLRTLRNERTRQELSTTLMQDIHARVAIGAAAALFVASVLLSGFFPIVAPADDAVARCSFFAFLGFAAGFSDRLVINTLRQLTGGKLRNGS